MRLLLDPLNIFLTRQHPLPHTASLILFRIRALPRPHSTEGGGEALTHRTTRTVIRINSTAVTLRGVLEKGRPRQGAVALRFRDSGRQAPRM